MCLRSLPPFAEPPPTAPLHCSLAGGCPTLTNMLVIIVGGIPIAMPTVLSVTLALGAFVLAKEGAIVSRMSGGWPAALLGGSGSADCMSGLLKSGTARGRAVFCLV